MRSNSYSEKQQIIKKLKVQYKPAQTGDQSQSKKDSKLTMRKPSTSS